MGDVDCVYEGAQRRPLVQSKRYSVYRRFDVAEIFRIVRLKPFSEDDTSITRGHADVVGPANMMKKNSRPGRLPPKP